MKFRKGVHKKKLHMGGMGLQDSKNIILKLHFCPMLQDAPAWRSTHRGKRKENPESTYKTGLETT